MKITGKWLRAPGTQEVFARLSMYQAYAVGGCVRNDLLGVAVHDVDIATSATPQQVVAACNGLKVVPTGIDHGTVTVIADGTPHEITTFRRDVETDGRRATVAFGTNIAEDAARRDFTMNALYACASGEVIDPLGGLPDLRARHVRFIGTPQARIREDYLRILRFFRFTALYGDSLDAEGLAACAELGEGLIGLSRERVGHEVRKLLAAPNPAPAVAAMAQAGLLQRILPGADTRALAPFVHLETTPDWTVRLAALGGDTSGLRLSKAEAKRIAQLRDAATSTQSPFALGYELGVQDGLHALTLRAALLEQPMATDGLTEGAAATFPIRPADLAPLTGPQLGAALATARAQWLASGGTLDTRALLNGLDTPDQ